MTAVARPEESMGPFGPHSSQGKIRLSSAGIHWFDRQTGANVLIDELTINRERWHRAPRYVSIALTNVCELRCPFCYAPKTPARLDTDRVLRWLEELDAEGCLGVGFGGGEPMAHPDFVGLCERAARRTRLAITFTTHGHRMREEVARKLTGNVHFIRVSMDGVGLTYEQHRGRAFDDFVRHLSIVATVAPFGINVVVNSETVDQLDAVEDFALRMGAAELLLLPERSVPDRSGIEELTALELTRWVQRSSRRVRLAVSVAGAPDGLSLADPFRGEAGVAEHAHIDATGYLRPDAFASSAVQIRDSVVVALDELRAKGERR